MVAANVEDPRVEQLTRDGYVIIPDALSSAELAPIRARYDELMSQRLDEIRQTNPSPRHAEVKRILERDPVFETLIDHPSVFPILRAIIGPDITLSTGGEGDYRAPHTPAHVSWHNDFSWMPTIPYPRQMFWLRCVWLIDDVTDDMAPFTLLPGSHRAERGCPADLTLADGQPKEIPGMKRITGKAGTCMINNTEIWHTNTPNTSDRARKIIMICYKHAWMRPWEDGYEMTREFGERQVSPQRRQLCGVGVWHRCDGKWDIE